MFTLKKSLLTASIISLSIRAASVAYAASHEKAESATMAPKGEMADKAMEHKAMEHKDTMAKGDAMAKEAMASKDPIIAVVNGSNIMKSTLDGYLDVLSQSRQGKPDMQAALDDLIATEIALQEAKKSDILEREESKKAISDYTRNVLLQTWTKEKVESFNYLKLCEKIFGFSKNEI